MGKVIALDRDRKDRARQRADRANLALAREAVAIWFFKTKRAELMNEAAGIVGLGRRELLVLFREVARGEHDD